MKKVRKEILLMFVLVILFTQGAVAREQSWSDPNGFAEVIAEAGQLLISLNLDRYAEEYQLWELAEGFSDLVVFSSGFFPVWDLTGEVEDVVIIASELLDYYQFSEFITLSVFILMDDGRVESLMANPYDVADWGYEVDLGYYAQGSIDVLPPITSIFIGDHYEGVGGQTVYAQDYAGELYDLYYATSFKDLREGYWLANLVVEDDMPIISGELSFAADGSLSFKVGLADEYGEIVELTETWSGAYTLILAEDQDYPPGTLLLDLNLNWWIYEGELTELEQKRSGIYRLDPTVPWFLPLYLGEGNPLYPWADDPDLYKFWLQYDWFEDDFELLPADLVDYTDLAAVRAFLAEGYDVNGPGSDGYTPLMNALFADAGQEIIDELISAGADLNQATYSGLTPLMLQLLSDGSFDTLVYLLESGAQVNQQDMYGNDALIWAAWATNDVQTLDLLIKAGSNLNSRDEIGATALVYAASYGNVAAVDLLVKAGADVFVEDHEGNNLLHWAVLANNPELIKYLAKQGVGLNTTNLDGYTPLYTALINEVSGEMILALIAVGVDVNRVVYESNPFLSAILFDYEIDVIKAFIAAGANVLVTEYGNSNALMYATLNFSNSNVEILRLLLEYDFKLDARDSSGGTALHWAAGSNSNHEITQELINAGISLNLRDIEGRTALMYAAESNPNPLVVRSLLAAGADGSLKCVEGKTAFDYAMDNENLVNTEEYWLLGEARF